MKLDPLPEGFHARPAKSGDTDAAARIIAAAESAALGKSTTTPEIVGHFWSTVVLEEQTIVVLEEDGQIVATAEIDRQGPQTVSVYAHVHPAWTGRGLGSFLASWGEGWLLTQAQGEAQVERIVRQLIPSANTAARRLLASRDYAEIRRSLTMVIALSTSPDPPSWPDGVRLASFAAGRDEREVHEAIEDAFQDVWGRPPSSYERFLANRPSRGEEADLWIIARVGSEIAGVSIGKLLGLTGWIDNVAVRRQWRGRGIGLALLQASFGAFFRRGITDVRLKVDATSLTGATRLYERAGMRVDSEEILYQKTL